MIVNTSILNDFRLNKKRSLTILLVLLVHLTYAQLQRRFFTYNVENGLAQNSTWDLFHDYRGFLWISTADGINRFDGYEMYHYKGNTKNPNSIYGVTFFNFKELPNKELWISHDRGISVYNRIKDNFDNIIKSKHNFEILEVDDKNRLWVIEERMKIHAIDIKSRRIVKTINKDYLNDYRHHTTSNSIKIREFIFTTLEGKDIIQINTRTDEVELVEIKDTKPGMFRYLSTSDTTFITFNSTELEFYEFTFSNHKLSYKSKPVLNYKPIKACSGIYFWNNKIYAASLEGYYIINPKTYYTEEFIRNFNNFESSYNYIQHLDVDSSNNLYICTNGMGIKVYSPYFNKFKHLSTKNENTNMVKSILKTKDGKIITGVYNQGIIIYYPNNTIKQFNFKVAHPNVYTFSSVLGMINYSEDEVLLMFADRLILFDHKKNKEVKKIKVSFNEYQNYPAFQNYNNLIYFSSNHDFNTSIHKINSKFQPEKIYSIHKESITCFKLHKGKILIGTERNFRIVDSISKEVIMLPIDVMVKSICITSNQNIYVSTISGLYEITLDGKIKNKYDVSSGLTDDFIYGVLEDSQHNLWMSHNKGLSVLNPTTKTFKHYTNKDGLQSNEFNTGAYYKDEDGLLYFGGVNGINIIDPTNIITNTYAPKIAINQINLFDEPYQSDTSYNERKSLNLDYFENTLSFDFSALEFSNTSLNTYKYILSGYDEEWISSGTKHFARYSNIPPGTYTLKILAANADGVWSKEAKTLSIHIRAPFWQTNWFYALCALLILIVIFSVVYIIIYRQKIKSARTIKAQVDLENERLRIARDLHDNVGAHLSYLISNLDWMISHPEQLTAEEERKRLENLTETGRQAILTLRQTIWAINNKALYIEDFADKFKTFAIKMLEFSHHIKINFAEEISINASLNPGITLHLFRICQEALSNILKHANANTINVEIKSNNEYLLYFKITDDGKGFDANIDYSKEHYGLVIMKERANECGAVLTIQTELGVGTIIELSLKYIK